MNPPNTLISNIHNFDVLTIFSVKGLTIVIFVYIGVLTVGFPIYNKKIKNKIIKNVMLDQFPWIKF